ncbi:uncharacterized protein [Engystomops pustulosus]|uniref:uncharacterized protein isoform X1 n=1 Tax=Engystomops pustulosus TaxID=76066 RepID=UPI003AFB3D63
MHGYKSARKWSLNGNLLQTRKDCALKKIYASDGDTCVIDLSATMRNKKKVDHLHQRRGKMNITMNYYFWWNQGPFDRPKAIFNHLLQTPKLKTSQAFSTLCPSFSSPGPSRPTAEEEDCTFFPVLSDSPIQEAEPLERPPRHTNRKRACTTNKMFLSLIMPPSLFSKESQEYYEKVWKHPQLKHFFNLCDRYCHQCTTLLHLQANHNNNGKVRKRCLHK